MLRTQVHVKCVNCLLRTCNDIFRDADKLNELQCMVGDQDSSKILIGCQENKLVSFDMSKVAIVKEVTIRSTLTYLFQSSLQT